MSKTDATVLITTLVIMLCSSRADARQNAVVQRNFLRNGSFEAGWCNEIARVTVPHDSRPADHTWITDETAFHGKYCLKIPESQPYYLNPIPMKIFTIPVRMPGPGLYTLSLRAKAVDGTQKISITGMYPATTGSKDNPGIRINQVPSATASAMLTSDKWAHLAVSVPGGDIPMYLMIEGENVFIDAIEFLAGEKPGMKLETSAASDAGLADLLGDIEDLMTPEKAENIFIPAAPVECGISDKLTANIHYREDGVTFFVRCHNNSKTQSSTAINYELINQKGKIVLSGRLDPIMLEPDGHAEQEWTLPEIGNGKYSLKYWIDGDEQAWGEHVFAVIPKPVSGINAPAGVLAHLTPSVISMMTRAGMLYYAALCDNIRIRNDYDVETGDLQDKSFITEWGDSAGMTLCMDINPAWWPVKQSRPWNERLPSRHPSESPDQETYYDAASKAAAMYGPHCKVWWIQDELEGSYHPHEFYPVFMDTVKTIRKHRPDAEFLISAMGSWVCQFFRVGGLENLDWMGGSVMGFGGDAGRQMGWLARRHNLKFWATAGSFTGFKPFSRLRGGVIHSNWRLHHGLINSVFLHNAKVTMMYRGLPSTYDWTMVHDPYNVFEADLSMTCALTLYAIAGQILAGAETHPDPLETTGRHGSHVWGFADGRTGHPAVCFFPGFERSVIIDISQEKLRFTDQLGNQLNPLKSAGSGTTISMQPGRFYFLYGLDIDPRVFFEKIKTSSTDPAAEDPPDIEIFAFAVPHPEDTVAVEKVILNRSASPWQGDRFHPQFNANPLPENSVHRETIRLTHPYRERYPIKPVQIPGGCNVWLATARRCVTKPVIDGNLSEWEPTASSALYFSSYTLGAIDRSGIHSHKDSFKILCDIGMDYRLEWFTGYDDEFLYFCARVFDDQLVCADNPESGETPDSIKLRFNKNPSAGISGSGAEKDVLVRLIPEQQGATLRVELETYDGAMRVLENAGAIKIWNDPEMLDGWTPWKHPGPDIGYFIETAIPWKNLEIEPAPGLIIGFDVFGCDTDIFNSEIESGTLRWAGGSNPTGYLRLGTL